MHRTTPTDAPQPTTEEAGPKLRVSPHASPEFVDLLESIVYGSDGVQYRTPDMPKTLGRLSKHAHCVELREDDELVGTYLLVDRRASAPGGPIAGVYRTCLAVAAEHGGRGLGAKLVDGVRDEVLGQSDGRVVLYGTIDPTNTRSHRLAQRAGYSALATLKVVTFTRLIPYPSRRVSALSPDERVGLIEQIERDMGHHALFDADASMIHDEVLTCRVDGRIVAAAQFVPKRVEVTSLGGRWGQRLVRVGRHIPFLRNFLRPTTVVQTAAIWAEDEHRHRLIELFECAMVRHRSRALVMMLDDREPLHDWLLGAMRLGWLQFWSLGAQTVRIMAGFAGVSAPEIAAIADRPFWVSALDLE